MFKNASRDSSVAHIFWGLPGPKSEQLKLNKIFTSSCGFLKFVTTSHYVIILFCRIIGTSLKRMIRKYSRIYLPGYENIALLSQIKTLYDINNILWRSNWLKQKLNLQFLIIDSSFRSFKLIKPRAAPTLPTTRQKYYQYYLLKNITNQYKENS